MQTSLLTKTIKSLTACCCIVAGGAESVAWSKPLDIPAPLATRITQVVSTNPRVLAARAAVESIRAQRQAARQPLYNPELGFEVERAQDDVTALGLSQTFDWSDKRAAGAQAATFRLAIAEANLARVSQTTASELVVRLAAYRTTRAVERIVRRRVELMQRFASLAEARRRAGDLGQVELNLARLALVEARLARAQAAVQSVTAEQAVKSITRANVANWPDLPLARITIPAKRLATQSYLINLPQVRARQAQVAAARSVIEVRTRQTRPDPTLSVRGGQENESLLAGVSISIPLYVRNNYHAEVDAANAELIRAQRAAYDAYRSARARLMASTARLRLTSRAWREWRDTGSESLRAQLDLLQRFWQAGELSGADYLVQTRQALDTRISAIKLRGQLWRAWAQWLAASGEIGRWLRMPR